MEKSPPVSVMYDFTRSGAGGYFIKPSNLFTYVDVGGTLKNLRAAIEGVAEVKLSGDLAVSRRAYGRREGMMFTNCTLGEAEAISDAATEADLSVHNAYFYLRSISSATLRYTGWFGPWDQLRAEHVRTVFAAMLQNGFQRFHYYCHDRYCTPTRDAMVRACIFQP